MHICWFNGQGSRSSIIHKNIMNGFKATRIWPFNPKTMDFKTRPNDANIANILNEDNDVFDGTTNES